MIKLLEERDWNTVVTVYAGNESRTCLSGVMIMKAKGMIVKLVEGFVTIENMCAYPGLSYSKNEKHETGIGDCVVPS